MICFRPYSSTVINPLLILILIFGLTATNCSSNKEFVVSDALAGEWTAETTKIKVRENTGFMKFEFTPGEVDAALVINKDKKVSGHVGSHKFSNGLVTKSNIYKVVIDGTGALFEGDPTTGQEISFWIFELNDSNMVAELRLTEGGAKFPMGELKFNKTTK